jgi:uncharacterized membrane protein
MVTGRDASSDDPPPPGSGAAEIDGSADDEKETGRVEALSDGVIAIAITLLIIEVGVPHVDEEHGGNLLDAVADQWPAYLAYVTSFWSIGLAWLIHHIIFGFIRRSTHLLLLLNTMLLLVIAFVPHPTAIVADYLRDDEQQNYAMMIYSGTWLVLALLLNALWWYARSRQLLARGTDRRTADLLTRRLALGPPLYLLALILSSFSFVAAVVVYLIVAVLYTFPDVTDRALSRTQPAT